VSVGQLRYFPSWAESVYRPVDCEAARRGDGCTPLLPPLPAGFKVLFAGNIGVAQDFPTILAAAEQLRERQDIHWVIAGDGRMRPWVQDEIERRGLGRTVHLLGALPMQDMPNLFARVDALLVTLRDEPIFALTIPGKIQSYLACGRPVIAALNGEGAEVVRRAQAGIACGAEDPGALAAAVAQMAALPVAERDAIGARARACYLAEFDREQAFRQLERWMAELRKPG
jgi:colanic acid biosynthesis glycosyl transferase WcaI